MYIGIRFKGYVKEEFRNIFEDIAIDGMWSDSSIEMFRNFGKLDKAHYIPCGEVKYMPLEWEERCENTCLIEGLEVPVPTDNYYITIATDGFERSYDEVTGYWTFQCSLPYNNGEIGKFYEMLPNFVDEVEHLEDYFELDDFSKKYELIDGKITCTNLSFKKY